jgi:hypothetical protein
VIRPTCGAIYVAEFGDTEEHDRLLLCTAEPPCPEHEAHLRWVHTNLDRFMHYVDQMRRYHATLSGVEHEVVALL